MSDSSKTPSKDHISLPYKREDDLVCLGVIQGPHGIKGEVKLRSYTENPKHIGAYGPLILKGCEETLTILKLRSQRDNVFVARFKEVEDRDTAELLKGQEVFITKEKLPKLEGEDTFYVSDLEGLTVHSTTQKNIGTVATVLNFGAGDILELKLSKDIAKSSETILIPFLKEWVVELNLDEGYMVIDAAYLAEYLKPFKKSDERWDENAGQKSKEVDND